MRLARHLLHFEPWQQGFILLDVGAAFGKLKTRRHEGALPVLQKREDFPSCKTGGVHAGSAVEAAVENLLADLTHSGSKLLRPKLRVLFQ